MSRYHLNRFLFDLKMSEEVCGEAQRDLDRALDRYELTADEQDAIRAGDPRGLRRLGAYGMLALYVLRLDPEYRTNVYWLQK